MIKIGKRWERGKRAEFLVRQALEMLEENKEIKMFGYTDRFSDDDLYGVDFWICSLEGETIALQVKTWGGKKQIEHYKRKGILFIRVPPEESVKDTEEKIRSLLRRHNKDKKKKRKNPSHIRNKS